MGDVYIEDIQDAGFGSCPCTCTPGFLVRYLGSTPCIGELGWIFFARGRRDGHLTDVSGVHPRLDRELVEGNPAWLSDQRPK